MLRTNAPSMVSYRGFVWPESGAVSAPDWDPYPRCGGGLHGLLMGRGDAGLLREPLDPATKWLVVEVDPALVVDLGGKVKVPSGTVVVCGDRSSALDFLRERGATALPFDTATAGDSGTATAGTRGTATAGHEGAAAAGDDGTATAGDFGTATAGNFGTATAGNSGTATAGAWGTATVGYGGTATAGYSGTAAAGDTGTATARTRGTATAGAWGVATAGGKGTAAAGFGGIIQIHWLDDDRRRIVTGYVGEGIEPNTRYRLDDNGNFERADAVESANAGDLRPGSPEAVGLGSVGEIGAPDGGFGDQGRRREEG